MNKNDDFKQSQLEKGEHIVALGFEPDDVMLLDSSEYNKAYPEEENKKTSKGSLWYEEGTYKGIFSPALIGDESVLSGIDFSFKSYDVPFQTHPFAMYLNETNAALKQSEDYDISQLQNQEFIYGIIESSLKSAYDYYQKDLNASLAFKKKVTDYITKMEISEDIKRTEMILSQIKQMLNQLSICVESLNVLLADAQKLD